MDDDCWVTQAYMKNQSHMQMCICCLKKSYRYIELWPKEIQIIEKLFFL